MPLRFLHTHTNTHTCMQAHTCTHMHAFTNARVYTHTGSNPAEGNGHFFPLYRQLYLSSFFDTLRPTQWRSLQMLGVVVPQIGVGVLRA